MEAAVGVVARILGPVQFFGGDDVQRHLERAGKGAGLLHVAPGQAGRIGQHGQHPRAQHAMRRGGQKRGVHAAGVSHHQASQLLQPRLQGVQLCSRTLRSLSFSLIRLWGRRHETDYTLRPIQAGPAAASDSP